MIIYTDRFLKPHMGGRQIGPFIIIRPSLKDREDIKAHEKRHTEQWINTTLLTFFFTVLLGAIAIEIYHLPRQEIIPFVFGLPLSAHALLYVAVPKYRLWAEVEAYKESLKHRPDCRTKYAKYIAEHYKLKVTQDEAWRLLGED